MKRKWKKRWIVPACLFTLVVAFFWPVRFFSGDARDVESIRLFDGNGGGLAEITDRQTIDRLVENLHSVYLRRSPNPSAFSSNIGFDLLVDISMKEDGKTCHFEIDSETSGKDGFYYNSYFGKFDYEGMKNLCRANKD